MLEEAILAGIEQILMIVSRSKNLIVDYFDYSFELEMFLQKANKLSLLEQCTASKYSNYLYTSAIS